MGYHWSWRPLECSPFTLPSLTFLHDRALSQHELLIPTYILNVEPTPNDCNLSKRGLTQKAIIKPPLSIARAALRVGAVCLFLYVCLSPKSVPKTRFSQELSNLALWSLLTTNRKSYQFLNHWKSLNRHISTNNHPILMKFSTQRHIENWMTDTWPNMKIQDSGRPPYWNLVFWP